MSEPPRPGPADVLPRVERRSFPLCVDLDGTLVSGDMFRMGLAAVCRRSPFGLAALAVSLGRGRAYVKRQVAERAGLDAAALDYNVELLRLLREERCCGRKLVLATGADWRDARAVAAHVGLFDEVLASDGRRNLTAGRKAAQLAKRFGRRQFDYVGNGWSDIPVWREARQAWVVSSDLRLLEAARAVTSIGRTIPPVVRSSA